MTHYFKLYSEESEHSFVLHPVQISRDTYFGPLRPHSPQQGADQSFYDKNNWTKIPVHKI